MNKIMLSLLHDGIINAIFLPSIVEIIIPSNDFDISFDVDDEDFNYLAAKEQTRYGVALDELGISEDIISEVIRGIDFSNLTQANNPILEYYKSSTKYIGELPMLSL